VDVSVTLPDSAYPDSNFRGAFVNIAFDPTITTISECRKFLRGDKLAELSESKDVNGATFYAGDNGSAAAGTLFTTKVNHALQHNICFEVSMTSVTTNMGNYTPGTVTEVNENEIWSKLNGILSTVTFSDSSVTNKTIYFGQGSEGNYSLIDVATGETKAFIPEGYEIVDQHNYNPFSEILILQKGSKLFSYSVSGETTKEIPLTSLKTSETVRLSPSFSEKDKFYIVINDTKSVEDGMFPYEIVGSRKYFFDATKNTIQDANALTLTGVTDMSGCYEYDSKFSRFFIWSCGEGIGASIPLLYMDIADQKTKELVALSEFGLGKDDIGSISLEYNNGIFFALAKGKVDKIITVDPATKETSKTTHILQNQVKKDIADKSYPYSVNMDRESNTIAIGGDTFVTLLKFKKDNLIAESKIFEEPELYANFTFAHQGKLYYQSRTPRALQVINLGTWEKEKSLSVSSDEEITLFAM